MSSNHRTIWEGIFENGYDEKNTSRRQVPIDMERDGVEAVSIS